MGKFQLTKVSKIKEINELEESDFSLQQGDEFYQFKYIDDKVVEGYEVTAGIWNIDVRNHEFVLSPTKFTEETILEEYTVTKDLCAKIDRFFSKVHVYVKRGVFPKRAYLVWGNPGCGKSQTISKICKQYNQTQDTAIVVWRTDKFEARDIKNFLASFRYDQKVNKFILIAEDIGGSEYVGGKMRIDSSLLSLLDNKEQTFTIPTVIISTTNAPENLLANIADRPDRFDDKIEIKRPTGEFRRKFLEFFSGNDVEEKNLVKISGKKYDELSVAHIKEIVFRSEVDEISIEESIDIVNEQSQSARNEFIKRSKLGL